MRLHCSILFGTVLSTFLHCSASDNTEEAIGPVEVCERETFKPRCAEDQVVIVQRAQYGRMSLGRCVTKDYGFVGCAVDVTTTLHSLCSGRGRCEVDGSHPFLLDAKSTSCAKDFASYLSVTYSCVTVASGSRHACSYEHSIALSATSGFIASYSAILSGYGAATCPWKLLPSGGRRLNITLHSFGNEDITSQPLCYKFATISDTRGPQELVGCTGDAGGRVIFFSEGGPVTMSFSNDVIQGRMGYFLIEYNVVECEDPKIPPNSRFSRKDKRTGEISCQNLDLKWNLECQEGEWIGHVGRCESSGFGSIDTTSTYGLLAVVAIGALIGMLVGGMLLWFCICCFRKCLKKDDRSRHLVPPEDLDYMTHFHKPWMSQTPAQPNWVDFGTMGRGHYETLPRPPNGSVGPKEYDQLQVRPREPESDYFITVAENNNDDKSKDNEDAAS